MSDTTKTQPSLPQHMASIAEAMRLERFEILRIITRHSGGNAAVASALATITARILERNR